MGVVALMFKMMYVTAAGILGLLCTCPPVMAQARPAFRAVVEDESGGVIIGAKVVLLNAATQERHEAVADEAGRVAFDNLPGGEYALTAESPGFKPLEQTITIPAPPSPVHLKLKVEVTDDVSVEALRREARPNPEAVDLDNDAMKGVPLPMGSGQLLDYLAMFLSPAAQSTTGVSLVVDGSERGRLSVPSAAIKQIVVNKSPFSAEYKKPGLARVEIVTEDGSRRHFEGNAGLFFNSSTLDSRNALADTKPDTDKTLFEGGFSGPLIKNRASFFTSWDVVRDHQSAVVNAQTLGGPLNQTVPTFENYAYGLGRVDVRPNPLLNVMVRYDYARETQRNRGVGGLKLPSLAVNSREVEQGLRLRVNAIFSPAFTNDLRVGVERETDREGGQAAGPQLLVRGAFRGGFSQTFTSDRSTELLIQDTATYFHKAHTIRFGARVQSTFLDAADRSNFGGLFEFASLDLFGAGVPSVFRINQGTPQVDFSVSDAGVFFQDEVKLAPSFTLMLGGRYDWQSAIDDVDNIAPRFGLSWSPNARTVVRGGAGIFYELLPERLLRDSLLYDGTRTTELVVANPSYTDPLGSGQAHTTLPSVVRLAPDIDTPYLTHASVSLERNVWRKTFLTIEYSHLRGDRLYRMRNINAPLPDTGLRPDPRFININQIESTAQLRSNALGVKLFGRVGDIKVRANYTYSRATNDVNSPLELPANNYDLGPERGRAGFDIRHRFNLITSYKFPAQITLSTATSLNSGPPYDITTGFDDNGDTVATDRPRGFTRNSGQGFGFAQVDLRLIKEFDVGPSLDEDPKGELDFYIDVFNILNRPNYDQVIGVQSSPLFGRPNSARQSRTIQFSIKYNF
jgi:hypothetical protein